MKALLGLFKVAGKLGLGGIWKHIFNIVITVVLLSVLWVTIQTAWNGVTYANKHYKELKSKNEKLVLSNESISANLKLLVKKTDSLKVAKTLDSAMFDGLIKQGQENQLILSKQNKEFLQIIDKYRKDGKVCYGLITIKDGLFNKRQEYKEIDCSKLNPK